MNGNHHYVTYDIRGIQKYIFAVPNLKCIIGASSIIDAFDDLVTSDIAASVSAQKIFGGGGRGAFECSASSTQKLVDALVGAAHERGLDLRIGRDEDFEKASLQTPELYAYAPESLEGEPCSMSGLWPVERGKGQGPGKNVHEKIWKRVQEGRADPFGQKLLGLIEKAGLLPEDMLEHRERYCFMKNVTPDVRDDRDDQTLADLGQKALGNRWAIIAMDGNDMGDQHRKGRERFKGKVEEYRQWLGAMSKALHESTTEAVTQALGKTIARWWEKKGREDAHGNSADPIVIPFRPLLVGGDDVVLLAHPAYAMNLAIEISDAFERISVVKAQTHPGLWHATGDRLTISAGVLFAGVSLPLAAGIAYAEKLLSGAKVEGRKHKGEKEELPSKATIDWESLTEKAMDTPQARRARELRYADLDLDADGKIEVVLTQRPYLISDFKERLVTLKQDEKFDKLPGTILNQLAPMLSKPYWDRCRELIRIKKQHRNIYNQFYRTKDDMVRTNQGNGGWRVRREVKKSDQDQTEDARVELLKAEISTHWIDAVLLRQEEQRMSGDSGDENGGRQ